MEALEGEEGIDKVEVGVEVDAVRREETDSVRRLLISGGESARQCK